MRLNWQRRLSLVLLLVLFTMPVFNAAVYAEAEEQQAQFVIPILVVNTSFLNVRTGPGVQYTSLVTLVGGTELPVLGVADDRVWYLVSTSAGNGWVNVDYTLPRGDFRNVPLIDPAVIAAPIVLPHLPVTIGLPDYSFGANGNTGTTAAAPSSIATVERFRAVVNVDAINVRTQPVENAASIATLFRDNTKDYAIVGRTNGANFIEWLAIDVPGVGSGWVEISKMQIRLSARYRDVVVIVRDATAVTSSPGGDATNRPILNSGSEGFLLDISDNSQFVQIELGDGTIGWVPFSAVITREGTPTDGLVGQQSYTGTNVQSGVVVQPGTHTTGNNITITGIPVPANRPAIELPRAIVNTGFLNVRSGPGAQYTTVATLAGGTELAVIGVAPDGVWYLVLGQFGQGWINEEFAIFRGVFDSVPLIRDAGIVASAATAVPMGYVGGSTAIYAGPGTQFAQLGVITGPVEYAIVARTGDYGWIQLNTPSGYAWVPGAAVAVRGEGRLIPVLP